MNSATQRSPWEIASPDAGSERFFATGGAVLKSDATRSGGRPFQDGRPFLYNKYTPPPRFPARLHQLGSVDFQPEAVSEELCCAAAEHHPLQKNFKVIGDRLTPVSTVSTSVKVRLSTSVFNDDCSTE